MVVRQRPNRKKDKSDSSNKKKKKSSEPSSSTADRNSNNKNKKNNEVDDNETLRDVFHKHPIGKAMQLLLLPYAFYRLYYLIQLQHPLPFFFRPAVTASDPRQLLIVAAPFSGNIPMTKALVEMLKLEIGHEISDTEWHFARDGTISWFHGIRFFYSDKEVPTQSLTALCQRGEIGFHPSNYANHKGENCSTSSSTSSSFDDCWKLACIKTVYSEWGCASSKKISIDCETQFEYKLHQVRNPLRTLEDMTAQYCLTTTTTQDENDKNDDTTTTTTTEEGFFRYASALFPYRDFTNNYSCLETAGYFLYEYQMAMIKARIERNEIDDFYRIEDTSPCDVARMGGFLDTTTTIYKPHTKRLQSLCDPAENNKDGGFSLFPKVSIVAQRPIQQQQQQQQPKDKDKNVQKRLGWKDLRGGMHGSQRMPSNNDLELKIRELFHAFGYDETLELEEEENISESEF